MTMWLTIGLKWTKIASQVRIKICKIITRVVTVMGGMLVLFNSNKIYQERIVLIVKMKGKTYNKTKDMATPMNRLRVIEIWMWMNTEQINHKTQLDKITIKM